MQHVETQGPGPSVLLSVSWLRPDPESFLEICRIHGLTPEKTIFIDDSIQHVQGSIKAGLKGLHLLPHQTPAELIDPLI